MPDGCPVLIEQGPSRVMGDSGLTRLVRAVIAERDMTLDAVARRAGLPLSTVGAYHSGAISGARPREETLRKLAVGLGIPAADLLEAAGIGVEDDRAMLVLFRQLPTDADRKQALTTLRAHVTATRSRHLP